jgi:hypothetical protein
VVTLTYDDTSTEDVVAADFNAKNITANPAYGNHLIHVTHNAKPITLTYGDLPQQKTSNLIVNPKVITFAVDSILVQTYTGTPHTPAVTVRDGITTLTPTIDFITAYTNNTNAGTATVTITGMGNYVGSSGSSSFIINPKVITFEVEPIPIQIYTGTHHTPAITVRDGTTTLMPTIDYTLVYTNNTNAGTAIVTIIGAGNYEGSTGNITFTILQTVSPNRFEYYWVNQHGSLITTSGGATSIVIGETLTITAQGNGYVVRQWYLNGVNTGQSGNTFIFSSITAGKHNVSWFVEKDGWLYNSNITITVVEPRMVIIEMHDSAGDGWNGNSALRVNVNGVDIATNVKVHTIAVNNIPNNQRWTNTYTFNVTTGDVVQLFWVAGTNQNENSFIVYYADTPPIPVFTMSSQGPITWNGSNALVFRLRNTMNSIANGTLLGLFTVQ